ncbi:hypothetical protein BSLG_006532 [Batrachochytrium salamandrivorans]|nr:hypothetical protein BSLG_006532 [Batrachochytrium salamandrivorans]
MNQARHLQVAGNDRNAAATTIPYTSSSSSTTMYMNKSVSKTQTHQIHRTEQLPGLSSVAAPQPTAQSQRDAPQRLPPTNSTANHNVVSANNSNNSGTGYKMTSPLTSQSAASNDRSHASHPAMFGYRKGGALPKTVRVVKGIQATESMGGHQTYNAHWQSTTVTSAASHGMEQQVVVQLDDDELPTSTQSAIAPVGLPAISSLRQADAPNRGLRQRKTVDSQAPKKWNQAMWATVVAASQDKNRGHKNLAQIKIDLTTLGLIDAPNIHIRNMLRTVALFGHKSDALLMDKIWAWHLANLSANSIDAMNYFAGEKNADAIVKLLYSKSMSPWDGVIQFQKPADKIANKLKVSGQKFDELRAAHLTGLLRRGLILIFKVSELNPDERFVKILAPFGLLCKEAERIQLRMQLNNNLSANNGVLPTDNGILSRIVSIVHARRQDQNDLKSKAFQKAQNIIWEGPTSLFYDGGISPKRAASFTRERLDSFSGGDISELGLPYVHFHFFSNARRNMLVHSIVSACTINFKTGWASRSNISDLLLKKVYIAFYAVHDGPLFIFGNKVEHVDKDGKIAVIGGDNASHKSIGMEVNKRAELYQSLKDSMRLRAMFSYLPINEIRDYYGERIGFYFAWLGYYTVWCQSAAIFGILTFMYGIYRAVSIPSSSIPRISNVDTASELLIRIIFLFDNEATPVYAFFMSIWAVLCLEFWKRQSQSIAFLWDVSDYRKRERIRPQWVPHGTRISPVTGKKENYESSRHKWMVRFVTSSIVVLCIILLLGCITALIAFKEYFSSLGETTMRMEKGNVISRITNSLYEHLASFSVAIFAVIQILIIDPIYTSVAMYLNDWDNYKTVSEYEDNLIFKGFFLSFLNNFALIIHTAVVKALFRVNFEINRTVILDFGLWDSNCVIVSTKFGITNCMADLIIQIATMFFFRQFLSQAIDVLWPLVSSRYREMMSLNFDFDDNDEDDKNLPQYVRDSKLVESTDESFASEYSSKVIQFGYLTMFSAAFPLAPVLAYLNNLIEMRVDTWKYLALYQRPFARCESSIDPLQDENDPGATHRVLVKVAVQLSFVLIFEHVVFLTAVFVDFLVPDIPQSVHLGQEAEEYLERVQNTAHEARIEREAKENADAITTAALAAVAAGSYVSSTPPENDLSSVHAPTSVPAPIPVSAPFLSPLALDSSSFPLESSTASPNLHHSPPMAVELQWERLKRADTLATMSSNAGATVGGNSADG